MKAFLSLRIKSRSRVRSELLPGESLSSKLSRNPQTTIDAIISFNDDQLLAAAYWEDNDSVTYNHSTTVIFTNEIFNRNIYVTAAHASGHTEPMNYYVELEEIAVSTSIRAQLAVAAARRTGN